MSADEFDVLIIGAGISGIGIACRLAREFPERRIAILERRHAVGGTWDLFRYPGIRSDSDMFSYAYDLFPWLKPEILAGGEQIRTYLDETIEEYGVREWIRFGQSVRSADWDSQTATWTVAATDERSGEERQYSTRFLVACTGYYDQERGYLPDYPGIDEFAGELVHPQHWPEGLDYEGKSVVVIGSGATAATLVPAMAGDAGHVTMLQRSPSYYFEIPSRDIVFAMLRPLLPARLAARAARKRSHVLQYILYGASRRWPNLVRRLLLHRVRKAAGPDVDMRHFTPRYSPWEERLCILPEGDLLDAVRDGAVSIVTDTIETFTENGIRLESGQELAADIVVSATGFNLRAFGGMRLSVDGQHREPSELMTYKAVLVEDMPNLAVIFGYINFSWTAKVDIAGEYLCRLLRHLDATGKRVAIPRTDALHKRDDSIMNALQSGYVERGAAALPRQGDSGPWHVRHDFRSDRRMLLHEPIDDGVLELRD